jgi:hypothetical protein
MTVKAIKISNIHVEPREAVGWIHLAAEGF